MRNETAERRFDKSLGVMANSVQRACVLHPAFRL
jgi:hypothetical protein